MPYVQLLCLAYSRRERGHCFAGIDMSTGRWVRPVGSADGGSLRSTQCLVQDVQGFWREPRILDIINIEVLGPSPKLSQPENWVMGPSAWQLVGSGSRDWLAHYVNDDPELFRGYGKHVEASEVQTRPPQYSLTLIEPTFLSWYANTNAHGRRHMDGTFSVCGSSYSLPLTDEAYERRLADIPLYAQRAHEMPNQILLVISLSDEWKEQKRHYKLIAGVIE